MIALLQPELKIKHRNQSMASTPIEPSDRSPKSILQALPEHYRTIGNTLAIAEAGSFHVGIPWLPPTARVCRLANTFKGPVDEYIRYALVTVSTTSLDLYCEDLENTALTEESSVTLCIESPSYIERYSQGVVLAALAFLASFACGISTGVSSPIVLTMAMSFAFAAIGISIVTSLEATRRNSFSRLLYNELLRRRGAGSSNGENIRLIASENPSE